MTGTMSRQPCGLSAVDAGDATAGQPGKTKRNWLSWSPSPGSDHPATEPPEATLRFSEAMSAAEKPMTTLLLNLFFRFFRPVALRVASERVQASRFNSYGSVVTAQRSRLSSNRPIWPAMRERWVAFAKPTRRAMAICSDPFGNRSRLFSR